MGLAVMIFIGAILCFAAGVASVVILLRMVMPEALQGARMPRCGVGKNAGLTEQNTQDAPSVAQSTPGGIAEQFDNLMRYDGTKRGQKELEQDKNRAV